MREKITEIIKEVSPEAYSYSGNNMMGEGAVDSFEIIEIVTAIEEEFDIEIDASLVIAENFRNIESIVNMVEGILE